MSNEKQKAADIKGMTWANSYCMARVALVQGGPSRLCQRRIPVNETYCEDCKKIMAGMPKRLDKPEAEPDKG